MVGVAAANVVAVRAAAALVGCEVEVDVVEAGWAADVVVAAMQAAVKVGGQRQRRRRW